MTAQDHSPTLYNTTIIIFTTGATKQDECRRAKRSSHGAPSATTRRPKGTVTHPRAHSCGTPSVRRGGFLPKSASLGSHSSALPSRCPVILTNILYYLYHPHIILYN